MADYKNSTVQVMLTVILVYLSAIFSSLISLFLVKKNSLQKIFAILSGLYFPSIPQRAVWKGNVRC